MTVQERKRRIGELRAELKELEAESRGGFDTDSGQIKYHHGFYAAARTEYRLFREDMDFLKEQELGIEPVRLDMLIIRRDEGKPLEDAIGRFFRKYSILEYKSPDDGLTIDDFYRVQAYACLYKSMGGTVDEIPRDEVTVSIFRHVYPRGMFEALVKGGFEVVNEYAGVYYVKGALCFPVQVIVTSKLPDGEYAAFKILAKGAKREDIIRFLNDRGLYDPEDMRAILRVSVAANEALYMDLEREGIMVGAFERVFHNELEAARTQGRDEGIAFGMDRGISIGEQRGISIGEKRGVVKTLAALIRQGLLSLKDAAANANMTEDEFAAQMAALGH